MTRASFFTRFLPKRLRSSVPTVTVVRLSGTIGIGTTAAVFALIQGALLEPPPYADPDRLVLLSTRPLAEPRWAVRNRPQTPSSTTHSRLS